MLWFGKNLARDWNKCEKLELNLSKFSAAIIHQMNAKHIAQ